jgi:hypothetical protein
MTESALEDLESTAIVFRRVPTPLAGSLRAEHKVTLVLLMLSSCWGRSATWPSLQVVNWAIRSDDNAASLAALLAKRRIEVDRPIVRFEPALDRAVALAVGLGLCETTKTARVRLTVSGATVAEQVKDSRAFADERRRLALLPSRITSRMTDEVLRWRL